MLKDEIDRTIREFVPHAEVYLVEDLTNAILSALKEIVPEEQATTHEYCDAYKNHVDRNGNSLCRNYCSKEIHEDYKKMGFNACRNHMLEKIEEEK